MKAKSHIFITFTCKDCGHNFTARFFPNVDLTQEDIDPHSYDRTQECPACESLETIAKSLRKIINTDVNTKGKMKRKKKK